LVGGDSLAGGRARATDPLAPTVTHSWRSA